jgi:hypothetical protein
VKTRARSEPVTREATGRVASTVVSKEGVVKAVQHTVIELGGLVYYRAELASANFSLYSDSSLRNTT